MKRLFVLPLLWVCGGSAWAQDQVSLEFRWADASRWRVVEQWELEVVSPDGQKEVHSGVVRSVWAFDRVQGAPVVSGRQALIVRTTPRGDADAIAISARLATPWEANLGPKPAAPAPEPVVAPAPEPSGDAPADGAAPAVVDPPAAPPVADVVVAPAPPEHPKPDLAEVVAGDPVDQIDRIFRAFDKQTLKLGTDFFVDASAASAATGEAKPAEVRRRVDPLQWCPDKGPGVACVEVGLRRQEGGASPEGLLVPAGATRTTETWVVEPSTLVPHASRSETVVGWNGDGGVWHARVTRVYTFLPADPPRALQPH